MNQWQKNNEFNKLCTEYDSSVNDKVVKRKHHKESSQLILSKHVDTISKNSIIQKMQTHRVQFSYTVINTPTHSIERTQNGRQQI